MTRCGQLDVAVPLVGGSRGERVTAESVLHIAMRKQVVPFLAFPYGAAVNFNLEAGIVEVFRPGEQQPIVDRL